MKRLLLLPILLIGVNIAQVNSEEIGIVVKSMSMLNFCKTKETMCSNSKPSQKRYNGMQGDLELKPVAEEYGNFIYKIKMKDGSILYYSDKDEDIFRNYSGLVKLSTHLKILEDEGKSIVNNSSIIVEKIKIDEGGVGYKYLLSTGQEIWKDEYESLKYLLPSIAKEHEEEFVRAIDNVKIRHDKVEDRFFISIKPSSGRDSNPAISSYIGFQDGKPWLRLKFSYTDAKWLFINKVLVKTDDTKLVFENMSFSRDNSDVSIWEWHDKLASDNDIKLIQDVISSEETIVRFYGRQYYKDRYISAKQKQQLNNILWIYEVLQ